MCFFFSFFFSPFLSRSIQIAFYLCDHLVCIVAVAAAARHRLDCNIAYSFNCLGDWGTQADAIPQNLARQGHETIDGVFLKEQ